jgi:hypothetical protein
MRELTRAHYFCFAADMRTPTTRPVDLGVVSEEDSGDDEEEPLPMRSRRAYRSRNWLSRVRGLARTCQNGKRLPPVGRYCLIIKGDADKDFGKMCVVSRQTKCMVSVVWRDNDTGATREKMKHPESLIQLEDGLRVEQDADGMLWVVRGDEDRV